MIYQTDLRLARARITLVVVFLLVIGALLSFLKASQAQEAITLDPTAIEATIMPGESQKHTISVANLGPEALGVQTSLQDFRSRPDGSFLHVPAADKSYSASAWLTLSEKEFVLDGSTKNKNETVSLGLEVALPENAEPGVHYANINFDFVLREQRERADRPIGRRALFVTITTPGEVQERAAVGKELTMQTVSLTRKPLVTSEIKNSGNVHLVAHGSVEFTDYFSRKRAGRVTFSETPVLPGKTGRLEVTWLNPPYIGVYKANGKVEYGQSIFASQKSESVGGLVVVAYWPVLVLAVLLLAGLVYLGARMASRALRAPRDRRSLKNDPE